MNDVKINESDVQKTLDELGQYAKNEMMLKSVRKGAEYLKEKIQLSLISKFPKAKTAKGKNKNTTMYDGIFIKTDKTMGEVAVKGTGNYLLPMFEGGTIERYRKIRYKDNKGRTRISKTEKGGYTGKIGALNFFNSTKDKESDTVLTIIEDDISKQINKIIKR